jgi:hypothetical protein
VSVTDLTSIAALVVAAAVGVFMPWLFKRQTATQLRAERTEAAKEAARQQEIVKIREDAQRDADAKAGDTVTWEKMNRALATAAQEERAAHQERLVELRASFTAETDRIRRQTDQDLDRYKQEISRLSDRVTELTQQVARLTPSGER